MIDPKINKQPKQNVAGAPKTPPDKVEMMPDTVPSQQTARIRDRAYELYERRGRESGGDEHDWLRAEQEILQQR
jgi:hypothetical protein